MWNETVLVTATFSVLIVHMMRTIHIDTARLLIISIPTEIIMIRPTSQHTERNCFHFI